MPVKAKCGRCSSRRELIQAPHRGMAWAICAACLATAVNAAPGPETAESKVV